MAHSPREDFTASLTRPKLDATLVLPSTEVRQEASPRKHTLFALASLNSRTAPSAEVSWSQLLALTLKPEREPVLAVGRHKDCHISVSDPRVSVNHFEILAKQAAGKGQNMSYECVLVDRSSNGTTVNGTVVGRGQSRPLHTGDQIEVLPTSRVGDGEMVAFLFHNTSESLAFGVQTSVHPATCHSIAMQRRVPQQAGFMTCVQTPSDPFASVCLEEAFPLSP
ncbi:unnamed protein product [Effrenium voratum]|nr:unnamed protein product [Effrenium voratum]